MISTKAPPSHIILSSTFQASESLDVPTFPLVHSPLSQHPTWNGVQMWNGEKYRSLAETLRN